MPTLVPYLDSRSAVSVRLPGEVVVLVERAGGEHHVGALGGQALGDAGADAPARTGDEHAPALEAVTHQISPFSVRKASAVSPM